ncbi:MAG: triose-phosphate isomerase [Hyphomicrobiales bacterium]|nr:MAG: triose-phosphate isomerase [Hyphomicrobiales bacterium]
MTKPQPLVSGNWKMNGLEDSLKQIKALCKALKKADPKPACDVMICPPATILSKAVKKADKKGCEVTIGAQNCHDQVSGAYTGDLSAEMLAEAGAEAVIVGHSERRDKATYAESDAAVRAKAEAAWRAGMMAIICVGETEAERRGGETLDVVGGQVRGSLPEGANADNTVIAYEPVWAIGSGLTPTTDDVAEVHQLVRNLLIELMGDEGAGVRILYGGSVKPSNAKELMSVADVDGALVGGASLKAEDFLGIIAAYG